MIRESRNYNIHSDKRMSRITINRVQMEHAGEYMVEIRNSAGKKESSAKLTVVEAKRKEEEEEEEQKEEEKQKMKKQKKEQEQEDVEMEDVSEQVKKEEEAPKRKLSTKKKDEEATVKAQKKDETPEEPKKKLSVKKKAAAEPEAAKPADEVAKPAAKKLSVKKKEVKDDKNDERRTSTGSDDQQSSTIGDRDDHLKVSQSNEPKPKRASVKTSKPSPLANVPEDQTATSELVEPKKRASVKSAKPLTKPPSSSGEPTESASPESSNVSEGKRSSIKETSSRQSPKPLTTESDDNQLTPPSKSSDTLASPKRGSVKKPPLTADDSVPHKTRSIKEKVVTSPSSTTQLTSESETINPVPASTVDNSESLTAPRKRMSVKKKDSAQPKLSDTESGPKRSSVKSRTREDRLSTPEPMQIDDDGTNNVEPITNPVLTKMRGDDMPPSRGSSASRETTPTPTNTTTAKRPSVKDRSPFGSQSTKPSPTGNEDDISSRASPFKQSNVDSSLTNPLIQDPSPTTTTKRLSAKVSLLLSDILFKYKFHDISDLVCTYFIVCCAFFHLLIEI